MVGIYLFFSGIPSEEGTVISCDLGFGSCFTGCLAAGDDRK